MRVLVPLPDRDFDVTEVSVPWKTLTVAGHEVVFATEAGATPAGDPLLLSGVIFGQLGAEAEPKAFYSELTRQTAFEKPIAWESIDPLRFDALVLPGGHAPGMRQYLASELLQAKVASFWKLRRPVAAICHAAWMLVEANAVAGRTLTSWPSLQTDIRNAGGDWVDEPVRVDERLITSRKPADLPAFCAAIVKEFGSAIEGEERLGLVGEQSFPASDPPPGPTAIGGEGAAKS